MDKKTSNSAHRLAVKEQKIIPNLVMKVEQFENSLLKLNKKFNIEVGQTSLAEFAVVLF